MPTNLLTPAAAVPSGVPPKNILAFVALGILVLIGLGAMFMDSSKTTAADAKKATLQEATASKDVGVKGNPKDIANAADKAGIPAALRAENVASAPRGDLPTAGVKVGAPLPAPYPLPMGVGTAGRVATEGSQTNIDAIRDTEISNAKPLVADYGAPVGPAAGVKAVTDPFQQLLQSQRAEATQRSQALAKATDPSQFAALMGGGAGGGAGQAKAYTTSLDADKAFLKEFNNSPREKGIRPSLQEAPMMLAQGSSIEAVILRQINSDLPGVITARTVRDIYDSSTVTRIVIPRGSTVIGAYSSDVRMGQSRLLFAFSRLILPDGQSFDLNGFGGSDPQGRSGMEADVDNHYFRLFGTSLLIGLLADSAVKSNVVPQGGALGGGGGLTATGQILTDTARSILDRNKDVRPTLTIESGMRVLIEVRRDMIFPSATRD